MSDSLCNMVKKDREVIDRLGKTGDSLRQKIDSKNLDQETMEEIAYELNAIIEELKLVTSNFKLPEAQPEAEQKPASDEPQKEQEQKQESEEKPQED